MTTVHIGNGAGFSGDRFDASLPVIEALSQKTGPKYLTFEVLAERTIATAQRIRQNNPALGYSPYLPQYIEPALKPCLEHGITIVSNMGAANPIAGARKILEIAHEQGLRKPRIGVLLGDDLLEYLNPEDLGRASTMEGTSIDGRPILAANVYLGARHVAKVLQENVDVVLVGRTTDSALILGPLIHEFGWAENDWDVLASGTICGHLLECGGQVTGAYFADPGFKDVPNLHEVGFPLAEVHSDGIFSLTKPEGTGGLVNKATITEQLLYEMHDPAAYLVPDVTADVCAMTLHDEAENKVSIRGIQGHERPATLKATLVVDHGFMAEAEMSYAGMNGYARARLAADVVTQRMRTLGYNGDIRVDVIGAHSVLDGGQLPQTAPAFDGDYRVRLCLISQDRHRAQMLVDELQSLYCSGPAAGGGFRGFVTEQQATASILLPPSSIEPHVRAEVIT